VKPRRPRMDAKEHFATWAPTYEGSFMWRHYFKPLHDIFEFHVLGIRGATILDVGCGTGDILRRFARAGATRVVGVDQSAEMLDVAKGLSKNFGNIEYLQGSAEDLPLEDETFDIVVSCVSFHHFPDAVGALKEIDRVLQPLGKVMICDLTDQGIRGRLMLAFGRLHRSDDHYYNMRSMTRMAREAGLDVTGCELIWNRPPTMLLFARKMHQ